MDINMKLSLEQKHLLSQKQLQSLTILNMNNSELQNYLNTEYLENPLLEYEEKAIKSKREVPASQILGADKGRSIEDYIKEQLPLELYQKKYLRIVEFLINNLDSNGYCSLTVSEGSKILKVASEDFRYCLKVLRGLEPTGIFAENLVECLLKQVEKLGIEDEVLKIIIRDYMEEISKGKISTITRALKISSLKVRKCIAIIESLNPKPLTGFGSEAAQYIIPDVIILPKEGEWDISLNDEWIGNYAMNNYYYEMMESSEDQELKEYFKQKSQRVRFILESIEKRRTTILKIAKVIAEVQEKYLLCKGPLVPLTMAEIAEQLGINTSTVSRAISGKYVQFLCGSVEMKKLLAPVASKAESTNKTTENEIKVIIKKMIETEDSQKPFSDQELTVKLERLGITLSRRAIAKYRNELGIKGSFERRGK